MADEGSTSTSQVPRKRLEELMLIRVVLVTIFLGSALAIDTEALANLASVKNATLLSLIVGTYVLTIIYALFLRRVENPTRLAVVQISLDLVISGVLSAATSGLDSIFVFLFYLIIINAAVVLGQRAALLAALGTCLILAFFAAIDLGYVRIPGIYGIYRPIQNTVFRLSVNGAAAMIVALLAGYLADRLGEATQAIARQQEDIRELKALNANILASLSSGLLTLDEEGKIIFWNQAAERITGIPAGAVLGNDFDSSFPAFAALVRNESLLRREFEFERIDGTSTFVGFSTTPLLDAAGGAMGRIIIFQDLTEVRSLEEKIRQSERLAAVGQLSAAIAHEIRNPLASISGAVEMLSVDDEDEESRILGGIVVREVDRLNDLITGFLEYCRPHELHLREGDLVSVLTSVTELFGRQHPNEIRAELPKEALACHAPEATTQILWNLLNNAREARSDATITLTLHRSGSMWRLSVHDDGPGVPPDLRERIFEPFFTTKPTGTGLGLATIYRLAEEQGGGLRLVPSEHGARFEVSIPAAGD